MSTENKQTVTPEEMGSKLKEGQSQIDQELDALWNKFSEGNYGNQGYARGATVVIPATLFQALIQHTANMQHVTQNINEISKGALQNMVTLTDAAIFELAKAQLLLVQQHMSNVDSGLTVSSDQLDKEDAEMKIQPVEDGESK